MFIKTTLIFILCTFLLIVTATTVQVPQYDLPPLPYPYNALEPVIDTETMTLHHDFHHAGYLRNFQQALNTLAEGYPHVQQLTQLPLLELLRSTNQIPLSFRHQIRNQGGGYYNHNLFWTILRPARENNRPVEGTPIANIINTIFGDFETFKHSLTSMGIKLFGSGWTWVTANCDSKTGLLDSILIDNLPNQDVPNVGTPILALDVFEHAYYLKYKNERNKYLENIWQLFNWDQINENLINACPGTKKGE